MNYLGPLSPPSHIPHPGAASDDRAVTKREFVERVMKVLEITPLLAAWPTPSIFTARPKPGRGCGISSPLTSVLPIPVVPTARRSGSALPLVEMAAHESARTTGLYDRRSDEPLFDEGERIGI
jgi:hypothetical protein